VILDPTKEIAAPLAFQRDDRTFLRAQDSLLAKMLKPWGRRQVLAMAFLETGGFDSSGTGAHNLAGVKIREHRVRFYRQRYGAHPRWFRAAGHVASGDQPVVAYMAYDNDAQFWTCWLEEFVGLDGRPPRVKIYAATGMGFAAEDPAWIAELLRAGYRGPITAGDPVKFKGAVDRHQQIVAKVTALLA
jgi:hypothetical protein